MNQPIAVTVNGRNYQASVEPRLLLSDFLRDTLGLTGTHVGCEHGVCGACTVLMNGDSIRSCLTLAWSPTAPTSRRSKVWALPTS